jgi:hypothetical protein
MKKLIVLALSFFSVTLTYAQDRLIKKDGESLQVKVEQISETEIKYRLFDFQDGPQYVLPIEKVTMLIYANGRTENFGKKPAEAPTPKAETSVQPQTTPFAGVLPFSPGKNVIGINTVGFILSQLHLDYRRVLADGKVAFNFPVVYSYDRQKTNINDRYMFWSLGCDFLFYPSGQRAFLYYLGIGQGLGQIEDMRTYPIYEPVPNGYYGSYNQYVGNREEYVVSNTYNIYFTNGIEVIPYKWFSFQLGFSLGVRRVYVDNNYFDGYNMVSTGNSIDAIFKGEIKMNVRF